MKGVIHLEHRNFVKLIEVRSAEEANKYLSDGWVLLSSGFHQSSEDDASYHSYSLGITESTITLKKYDDYDYGF